MGLEPRSELLQIYSKVIGSSVSTQPVCVQIEPSKERIFV